MVSGAVPVLRGCQSRPCRLQIDLSSFVWAYPDSMDGQGPQYNGFPAAHQVSDLPAHQEPATSNACSLGWKLPPQARPRITAANPAAQR